MIGTAILKTIAAAVLVWALDRHPYDYYIVLRWIVTGVAAYVAYRYFDDKAIGWGWTFVVTALIFNPIFPVHLSRDTWAFVDIAAAGVMVASIVRDWYVRRQMKRVSQQEEEA